MSSNSVPILNVVKEVGKFLIQDNKGSIYGRYDKKDLAETDLGLWNEYYAAPLAFGSPHD